MQPVVEYFEIRQNTFTRWLFAVLTLLAAFALGIGYRQSDTRSWIALVGILLFGCGWLFAFKNKIVVQQAGFELRFVLRPRFIAWNEITALQYEAAYHGHGMSAELKITAAGKSTVIQVKQYQAKQMQRFFEVLNEQCKNAVKNIHFLNQAARNMNWRNKLKMF